MMRHAFLPIALLLGLTVVARESPAADEASFALTIKDHKFQPSDFELPAGTKVKLVIKNLDPTPEEFESYELNREKVVVGGGEIVVYVGPLKPGTYPFFGDFHKETAQGRILVK